MQERFSPREDLMLKELDEPVGQIERIARDFGLDFYPTHFELVPPHIMYEFGAYGLPGRFSHWTHGREFYRMKTMYDYGMSEIYELVFNCNPTLACLMASNDRVHNLMVVAHVLAHGDFFKNNFSFTRTNRKILQTAALHADRKRRYEYEYGQQEVEECLDAILSIETNIDPYSPARPPAEEFLRAEKRQFEEEQKRRRPATEFDDIFEIGGAGKSQVEKQKCPFPTKEEQDLLWFIASFSPVLEDWQRDLIFMVREESQYFVPQRLTKVMNEGWATFWHVRIMREMAERGFLTDGECLEWFRLHAGVANGGHGFNPYFVGWQIWEDIERKSRGEVKEGRKEKNWLGEELTPGHYQNDAHDIFTLRRDLPSDQAFLRNYLTDALVDELDLYPKTQTETGDWKRVEENPEKVRSGLVFSLSNMGMPLIHIAVGGGDYGGNRELYLKHVWDSVDLDLNYAERVIKYIFKLWGRSVHLETRSEGTTILLTVDGKGEVSRKKIA